MCVLYAGVRQLLEHAVGCDAIKIPNQIWMLIILIWWTVAAEHHAPWHICPVGNFANAVGVTGYRKRLHALVDIVPQDGRRRDLDSSVPVRSGALFAACHLNAERAHEHVGLVDLSGVTRHRKAVPFITLRT